MCVCVCVSGRAGKGGMGEGGRGGHVCLHVCVKVLVADGFAD